MEQELETFRKIIDKHEAFVLTTHINPDPDAIGSELALSYFLRRHGKKVHILNQSPTPVNCEFLDSEREIAQYNETVHKQLLLDADVIFIIDTNHLDRFPLLKPAVLASKAYKVCIDHHLDRAEFADLYIIDEAAAATGEILYTLFMSVDRESITPNIAEQLYAAIMTDTGSFRFPKTDAELHHIIASLIDRGADPISIYTQIYEQGTPNRALLLGYALRTLTLAHENKVAHLHITRKMFQETVTDESDTENIVNYALTLREVRIALLFTELDSSIKISFRSKGDIAINLLAQQFGGNGHKNAAGARIQNLSLKEVMQQVVHQAEQFLS
ncbi:MAG: bifunctional oligoribonuclease/PAP phosphatase NrnA [bacterium]